MARYRDRAEGGRVLAEHLGHLRGTQPLILGMAGGGVVVAAQVAASLEGTLAIAVAERFGPPGNPDLTVGAVASDGIPVVDGELVARLGLGPADLAGEVARGAAAARRRARALRSRRALRLAGRVVVVVDDGVAAGLGLRGFGRESVLEKGITQSHFRLQVDDCRLEDQEKEQGHAGPGGVVAAGTESSRTW